MSGSKADKLCIKLSMVIVKKIIFVFISLYCSIQLNSQNLVPNSSFEEFINFANNKSNGWHGVQKSDTPDYFNLGEDAPYNNVFNEFVGGTKPKTGNGLVGIFCYRINPQRNIRNIREFIENGLINSLEKDSLYRVEISLCLDAESNTAVNNFGVFFSQTSLREIEDSRLFSVKPQIEFNFSYADSSHNWITLQSFYKANGQEKFIILGNFKTDKATKIRKIVPIIEKGKKEKWELVSGERASYYYIDDILVVKTLIIQPEVKIAQNREEDNHDTLDINDIKIDSAIILKNIIFEFNKSELLPESYSEVYKLYKLMANNPNIRIKLEGHTDNIGSYNYNLQLSLKRVESVAYFLIEKGISPNRIELAGYSYAYPLASNDTEEGRKINRRVVFKIVEK